MGGRNRFEAAVARYELRDLAPPAPALGIAEASLDRTGLFLLGETHGIAQTPQAILGLASRLGIRALAFEWSYDEVGDIVQQVLSTGAVDLDALWTLPPSAEVFSGDGRFTAGHVRLLERLSDRLDRILALDRVGSEGQEREDGMAERLLAGRRAGSPMLAILGAAHVVRRPVAGLEPVGLLVERALPGVANGFLVPDGRTYEGLPHPDARIPIGGDAAVVPRAA
jgi:hypothetical protein